MKLGFIGCGNMAGAIMGGIIKKEVFKPEEIIGSDVFVPTREKARDTYGIQITDSNLEVVEKSEVIVLAVKPQFYESVITEIKDKVTEDKIIITIAPGKTLAWLEEKFGKKVKIVRTMPNTPAMVMESDSGETDGRSRRSKRQFTGICIYPDRSNGRRSCFRWYAKSSGL